MICFGDLRIGSVLFADDFVLLASSGCDLLLSLEQFPNKCEVAGRRISNSKSETTVLSQKTGDENRGFKTQDVEVLFECVKDGYAQE